MVWKASKALLSVFTGAVGGACLWYLIERFQWRESLDLLLKTDFLKLIILIFLAQFAYIVLRAWRWRVAVLQSNPDVSFFELYWLSAIVLSFSIFTPGQSGEALKIEILKRRGLLDRLPGFGIFTLERALDVLVIAGMGGVGLLINLSFARTFPQILPAIGIIFALGLPLLYLFLRFNHDGQVFEWLVKMRSGIGTPLVLFKMSALTLGSWFFVVLGWYVSLRAINIDVPLADMLWLVPLVTLGSIFSLLPGGLGIAEVLIAESLIIMGIPSVEAQAGALILRVYGLIVLLFGGVHLLLWLISRRVRKSNIQKPTKARAHMDLRKGEPM